VSYKDISNMFTLSVEVPFVKKSTIGFDPATNLKASGELCDMSDSCLLVVGLLIKCVLNSSITVPFPLDSVNQYGFC